MLRTNRPSNQFSQDQGIRGDNYMSQQLINCSAPRSETPFMAPLHDVQPRGRELDLEEDLPPVDLPGLLSRCVHAHPCGDLSKLPCG